MVKKNTLIPHPFFLKVKLDWRVIKGRSPIDVPWDKKAEHECHHSGTIASILQCLKDTRNVELALDGKNSNVLTDHDDRIRLLETKMVKYEEMMRSIQKTTEQNNKYLRNIMYTIITFVIVTVFLGVFQEKLLKILGLG